MINQFVNFLGAILSIAGTGMIWFDTQKTTKSISKLLLEVAETIGYWQDNPLESQKISGFKERTNESGKINKRGFILLFVGFICQLTAIIWGLFCQR